MSLGYGENLRPCLGLEIADLSHSTIQLESKLAIYLAEVITDAAKRLCPTVRPARVLCSWGAQPATPHDLREIHQC